MILLAAILLQSPVNELTEAEKAEGYVLLFNGKDLSGFKPGPHRWLAQDGTLTFRPVVRTAEDTFTSMPLYGTPSSSPSGARSSRSSSTGRR